MDSNSAFYRLLSSFWIQASIMLVATYLLLFQTPRTEFVQFFGLYTVLFISYFLLFQHLDLKKGLYLGSALRILAFVAVPVLSDDFYRFLWDGNLTLNGINAYAFTPHYLMEEGWVDAKQWNFDLLNSPDYFSVYPPLNQYLFAVSSWFASDSSVWIQSLSIKVWIVIAELFTIWFLPRVLKSFHVNERNALLYSLNPLVIIELSGNAHYEGVMIALLLVALYFYQRNLWTVSALFFALSVSVKLLPLMFLPLFWQYLKPRKTILYAGIVGVINILLFLPFVDDDLMQNAGKGLGLYFQSFQFNSFVFSIVHDFATEAYKGSIASLLLIFPISALAWFTFSKTSMLKNLPAKMGMSQAFFYFFSAVIHPWYLSMVILLSSFHSVKYILVWSYVIGLSYFTYRSYPYEEAAQLVAIQYLLVFLVLFIDWIQLKRKRYSLMS